MNEDTDENSATLPKVDPQSMNSPPPQKPKSMVTIIIAIIAVAIIVAVIISVVVATSPTSSALQHFGFVSVNMANNITGVTLTGATVSATNTSVNGVIKAEAMEYNSTSGGHIIISVLQFSNANGATNFYNKEANTVKNITRYAPTIYTNLTNGSYKVFDYLYASASLSSYYEGLAVGHNGQFIFVILDVNIPLSNINNLVRAQINAMT